MLAIVLCAYPTIFKKNLRASYFTTIYIDAFAGTGHRVESANRRGKAAAYARRVHIAGCLGLTERDRITCGGAE